MYPLLRFLRLISSFLFPLFLSSLLPSSRTVTDAATSIVFTIEEETPVGTTVFELQKEGRFPPHTSFQNGNTEYFDVTPKGAVLVKRQIDREDGRTCPKRKSGECTINFVVLAGQSQAVSVTATISDKNDNYPKFRQSQYKAVVDEDASKDHVVIRVTAEDEDEGPNAELHYRLATTTLSHMFRVEERTGEVKLRGPLDYSKQRSYEFHVSVRDSGSPTLTTSTLVFVKVLNRIKGMIVKPYPSSLPEIQVVENSPVNILVATVTATGRGSDVDKKVICALSSRGPQYFRLLFRATTGDQKIYGIHTEHTFDREVRQLYDVTVTCMDRDRPSQTDVKDVQIRVMDINDNSPRFSQNVYNFQVKETSGSYRDQIVGVVMASDADFGRNGTVQFRLAPSYHDLPFNVLDNGRILIQSPIDREKRESYSFEVIAHDMAPDREQFSATVSVRIEVLDINDNTPEFVRSSGSPLRVRLSDGMPVGSRLATITATDADSGANAEIRYSLTEDTSEGLFTLDPSTGTLLLQRPMWETDRRAARLRVRATDLGRPPRFSEADVLVDIDRPPRRADTQCVSRAPPAPSSGASSLALWPRLPSFSLPSSGRGDRGPQQTARP